MEIKDYEHKRKRVNRNSTKVRVLLVLFCVLFVGTGVVGYLFYDLVRNQLGDGSTLLSRPSQADNNKTTENSNNNILNNDSIVVDQPNQPDNQEYDFIYNGKKYVRNDKMATILFLGIDTNTERRINKKGYRSDMVMACAIDVEKSKATLISIPRDTYTTVYKRDEDTGEITETLQDKINAAYSYGGGADNYSFPNAMTAVQMFLERTCELETPLDFSLNIPIGHYASIDMDGITQIASAVGGVKITLERGIPNVGRKGQTVTLKYQNAEDYIRTRHDAGGDLDRARRQQKFMIELARTIKQKGASDLVGTVLDLYDEVNRYVRTKLSPDQIIDLAKILMRVDIDAIEMITIPTTGKKTDGKNVEIHDEEATLDIILNVYYKEVS